MPRSPAAPRRSQRLRDDPAALCGIFRCTLTDRVQGAPNTPTRHLTPRIASSSDRDGPRILVRCQRSSDRPTAAPTRTPRRESYACQFWSFSLRTVVGCSVYRVPTCSWRSDLAAFQIRIRGRVRSTVSRRRRGLCKVSAPRHRPFAWPFDSAVWFRHRQIDVPGELRSRDWRRSPDVVSGSSSSKGSGARAGKLRTDRAPAHHLDERFRRDDAARRAWVASAISCTARHGTQFTDLWMHHLERTDTRGPPRTTNPDQAFITPREA